MSLIILLLAPGTYKAQEAEQLAKVKLTSVSPSTIPAGSGNTFVLMTGSGFKNPITAQWNNTLNLVTTLQSTTQMTALIPSNVLVKAGTGTIRALQGGQGNQTATSSVTITISPAAVVAPTLTTLAPAHVIVGNPASTIVLNGTGFVVGVQAFLDTSQEPVSFVSATQLQMGMPQVSTTGTSLVKVVNPDGGTSNTLSLSKIQNLSINSTQPPAGMVGVSYTFQFTSTGGTPPITWSISSGTPPAGLALNASTGVLGGNPTAAGSTTFTVQVTDSTGTLARMTVGTKKEKKKE